MKWYHAHLTATAFIWLSTAGAAALQIDGLRATEPISARAVQPQLDGQRLTLPLADGANVRVQPWPSYLPQQFGPQRISGELRLLPAGTLSRLELTRAEEQQPWLMMAHGSRPHGALLGGWQLIREQGQWLAQQGERRVPLIAAHGKPAQLTVEGAIWCFYLLDSRVPASLQAAQQREQEPQLDWVMLRQESCRTTYANLTPTPSTIPD